MAWTADDLVAAVRVRAQMPDAAGDGAIGLDVETLDVTLKDVTRPYVAPSRKIPDHNA